MNELARRVASLSLQRSTKLPTVATHRTLSSLGIARNIPTTDTRKVRFDSAWSVGALPQSLTILKTQFSTNALANGTANSIVADEKSGKNYGVLLDTRNLPKLRPGIIQKRLANCKTYIGRELAIRQSPWKLNRVCQLASGLTLDEAVTQLRFCNIKNADLVAKVLKRTSNLADIRDGLQMSQLEVAECYTNKAMMLKRNMPMGRGR
jgi:Ribosomal protein L22p/L17e